MGPSHLGKLGKARSNAFPRIFTELSLNGGKTWTPSEGNVPYQGDLLQMSGSNIPEPATLVIWSLLGALAAGIGWWRRRKAA